LVERFGRRVLNVEAGRVMEAPRAAQAGR